MTHASLARAARLACVLALAPALHAAAEPVIVNDVTQLNPVAVERVVEPRSVEQLSELVRTHRGPISIGGARHSMGGQIATENALFIDMRRMDRVLDVSLPDKRITVETGITWRKVQEAVDRHGLSVKIMQSYANFTVGGSLSVNVHGRYVGQGPLIHSVRSVKLVLADGSVVAASPSENAELFYGAIGGYGGLGILVEATLDLADDVKMERDVRVMPLAEYTRFFSKEVRDSPRAIFHNGDIYPPRYDRVTAITWSETDRPATVAEHLQSIRPAGWVDHLELFGVSEMPLGQDLRAKLLDRVLLRGRPVVWRNYEASYDAGVLEPASRARSTYVLEEYFVPVERFDDFAPAMARIFRAHRVNVLNVSIRHARPDPGSLLAWARSECFAFVVYYKQGTSDAARREVGVWTRELIDAALAAGGTYYLPYQIHATEDQFRRAYPRAAEYFALKRRVDPDYRFRNKLWDRYYPQALHVAAADSPQASTAQKLRAVKGYARAEDQTFLTLPEWYIVFSADEYARFLDGGGSPSAFPFFASIGQFWSLYGAVLRATWGTYPFNWGYHAMIGVIGASYTAEYAWKGLYEGSIGRLSEWLGGETEEDRFLHGVASDYAAFVHHTPWYEFPFAAKLVGLWSAPVGPGESTLRQWERRLSASAELGFKAAWGGLMRKASATAYDPEELQVLAWAGKAPSGDLPADPPLRSLDPPDAQTQLLGIPRYEPFTAAVTALAAHGVPFIEIAGNRTIVMTVIAPRDWQGLEQGEQLVHEWPILTDPSKKRVAMALPVERLHAVIPRLASQRVKIDHVYDY